MNDNTSITSIQTPNNESIIIPESTSNTIPNEKSIIKTIKEIFKDDDNTSFLIGIILFLIVLFVSAINIDLYLDILLLGITFSTCYISCYIMDKKYQPKDWLTLCVITYFVNRFGGIPVFKNNGIGSSFWGIIVGIIINYMYFDLKVGLKGEYFIKIGVVLGVINIYKVLSIGIKGLIISWVDTSILMIVFISLFGWFLGDWRNHAVLVGGTTVCGSSAATSFCKVVDGNIERKDLLIAIMGVANVPLIPLMPLAKNIMSPEILGCWIGGSIDSVGQVVASANITNDPIIINTAIVIKMLQTCMVGIICFILGIISTGKFDILVIINKFPRFVIGFIITSIILTFALPQNFGITVQNYSSIFSEWFALAGMVLIGSEINFKKIFEDKDSLVVIITYLIVQSADLCTTYGWAVFAYLFI